MLELWKIKLQNAWLECVLFFTKVQLFYQRRKTTWIRFNTGVQQMLFEADYFMQRELPLSMKMIVPYVTWHIVMNLICFAAITGLFALFGVVTGIQDSLSITGFALRYLVAFFMTKSILKTLLSKMYHQTCMNISQDLSKATNKIHMMEAGLWEDSESK